MMTYGEQISVYKDAVYLQNGKFKTCEKLPSVQRMPPKQAYEYYNAKLERIWAKMKRKKPPPAAIMQELKRRLREHEQESKEIIKKIMFLCDCALGGSNLKEIRNTIKRIKEAIDE
ncbi:MAG: hypothetical protein LUC34_01910 [Campylobacter sp.]|nr:hypothetical protein [Campylobacter sp.]